MKYSIRVVLVGIVEAANSEEAYEAANFHEGDLDTHEVEITPVTDAAQGEG